MDALAYRNGHRLFALILLVLYTIFFVKENRFRFFFLSFFACDFACLVPDLDLLVWGIGGHRNPIFHSAFFALLLVPIFQALKLPKAISIGFILGLMSHLLIDIYYFGYIRYIPGKFLGRIWLAFNSYTCTNMIKDL